MTSLQDVTRRTPSLAAAADRPRPFVKWAGGKTRLLPMLLPYVPASFARYHEPFLGGGAMLFAIHGRGIKPAYAADLNADLVNVWRAVLKNPEPLYQQLIEYAKCDSETFYYEVRAKQLEDPVERAAHFIYVNRTAWNGLYRVNRWGVFNVPWGARKFVVPSLNSFVAVSRALNRIRVRATDFRDALQEVRRGDFVYLDPPYLKISDTSKFNGYTQRRFRMADLTELSEQLELLTRRGAMWILSNRDSAQIRELFADYEIVRLTVRRSVAAQNRRDIEPVESPEVIVSNRRLVNW